MTAAVTAQQAVRGRNTISSRAVRRVVSAVTADALDVDASDVSVELADHDGALTVVARTPIRVAPLGDGGRERGTLLERLTAAQTTIRQRVLQLTGSTVERVDLRVTAADMREKKKKRVQ